MLVGTFLLGISMLGAGQDGALPYEDLALKFFTSVGLEEADAGGVSFEGLLSAGFVRFRLGGLDVRFPRRALRDPDRREEFQTLCRALVEAQRQWIDWTEPGKPSPEGRVARADAAALAGWIRSWRRKHLTRIGEAEGDVDLLEWLAPKDSIRTAASRFAAYLEGGGTLRKGGGLEGRVPAARLVLVPTRSEFVTFACAVGYMEREHRPLFWVPGASDWVEFHLDRTRVVALEFTAGDDRDYGRGIPMDARNPRGMEEQVVQLAYGSLLENMFGDRMDAEFLRSLANDLVIAQFGEVDTRSDGDTGSRSTSARSVFVPGGAPQGGALPPNSAQGPWRKGKGADHFVGVLRRSQRLGAKEIGQKKANDAFQLVSEGGRSRHVVRSPFVGPAAASTEAPPAEFERDWLEFLRAYRIAFIDWLREHGAGKRAESHARFAGLMRLVADPGREPDFAGAFGVVYGLPLSSLDGEDLEGRFLTWLAKQK